MGGQTKSGISDLAAPDIRQTEVTVKKVNYIYYIILLALWPAVDYLLTVGTRISPVFFWLLPLYIAWLLCSQFLLYWLRLKMPLKRSFHPTHECRMEWSTFWLDEEKGELAGLFLFHPLRVQYIPVGRIDAADVTLIGLSEDKMHVQRILFRLVIDGREYKMCADSMGRFGAVNLDGYGGMTLYRVREFVGGILEAKRRLE